VKHLQSSELGMKYEVEGSFAEIEFDFVLLPAACDAETDVSSRVRASA
jgi:hypothetical protein